MSEAMRNGAGGSFLRAGAATWVVLWMTCGATNPAGATVYVDRDAPGPIHNGASWTTAFVGIQQAVDAAAAKPGGDEVWVAAGVYSGDILTSSGVRLYGGFLGADAPTTETALDQRDWVSNVTELSGSSTDHLLDFDAATTVGIDGFTFAAGTDYAIVGTSANARIAHCRFPGNSTAIHWWNDLSVIQGEIALEDCQFDGNGTALEVENIRRLSLKSCQIDSSTLYAVSGSVWELTIEDSVISDTEGRALQVRGLRSSDFGGTVPEGPSQAILRTSRISGTSGAPTWIGGLIEFAAVVAEGCDFLDNREALGLSDCDTIEVSGCRFLRNKGAILQIGCGGGGANGCIHDSLFQDNGWPPPNSSEPVDDYAPQAAIDINLGGGLFVVENCQFLHNATHGSAICSEGPPLDILDCTFRENVSLSHYWSGAIFIDTGLNFSAPRRISRCVIENNTAVEGSPMVRVHTPDSFVVEDTRIVNNADAGGIDLINLYLYYGFDASATVARCVIENNGPNGYSGVYVYSPKVVIEDTRIQGNDTDGAGSMIAHTRGATVSRCKILDNTGQWPRGGVELWGGMDGEDACIRIVDSQIVGNSASDGRPGVYVSEAKVVEIGDSVIAGNRGGGDFGGGIALSHISGESRISGCVVTGNQEARGVDGISVYSAPLLIENCVIAGQRDSCGACGVSVNYGSSAAIANCIIFGNTGANEGVGIHTDTDFPVDVSNTIIARNSTLGIGEYDAETMSRLDSCLFFANGRGDYYSDDMATTFTGAAAINALPNGTGALNSGNVEGDPRFVPGIRGVWAADGAYDSATSRTVLTVGSADAAFTTDSLIGRLILSNDDYEDLYVILSNTPTQLTVLGDATAFAPAGRAFEILDFHLDASYCSPALDTGTELNAPDTDFDGAPRPVDLPGIGADGTGTAFDIGAYELQETTPTRRLVVAPESVDFGTAVVGETSIPTTITLTNTGTAAVSFRGQGLVIAGADADQFALAPPDFDPIAPCETRLAFVSFTPSAAGTHSATLRVLTDDDLAPTLLIPLTGEAIVQTPTPTETPTPTATPAGPDADHDGISDVYERAHGSDPYDPSSLPMNLDLDGNGLVDRDDALALYQALSGQIPANPDADYVSMDFNGDGETNILDALLFYRNRAGVIPMIPVVN